MSHFTHIKTRFQNLFYLEKALKRLNIKYQTKEESNQNLVIKQSNNSNIEFAWNKDEYELVIDISFWEQAFTIESFVDKISKQYVREVIIGESQKTGFQPVKNNQNIDGSTTLVLERWN